MIVSEIQCSFIEIISFFSIKILTMSYYAKYMGFRVLSEKSKSNTRYAYKLSRYMYDKKQVEDKEWLKGKF